MRLALVLAMRLASARLATWHGPKRRGKTYTVVLTPEERDEILVALKLKLDCEDRIDDAVRNLASSIGARP